MTDIGLANAVVRRLADLDPEHYGEAAAKLELKAKRAAERRAEQLAHEKNIRQGKRKPKAAPVPAAPESPAAPASRPKAAVSRKKPSRPSRENRPRARAAENPYAHSRPVKKGKGSFRKKES